MSRVAHYWSTWKRLSPLERRLHGSRVVERLLRRDPRIRALGLAPDHPRWGAFRRALSVTPAELCSRLRGDDVRRGPLFAALGPRSAAISRRHPDRARRLSSDVEAILSRTFDLLGSGPVRPLRADGGIDWHLDPVSGLGWDPASHYLDLDLVRGDGSDVKWPWELSRFQHLLVLAQAGWCVPAMRSRCAAEAMSQIDDWIARNPRGLGVNWSCSMEVAIRAFNWLAALALFRDAPEWNDAFILRLVRSLWTHGRHIRVNLEIGGDGLTSNHYLADVLGLFALGCALPELIEAAEWRAFARDALIEEMQRQVLDDGVDFERSIPYHRLVGEMMVHAALIATGRGEPFSEPFLARLAQMLEFTVAVTRADGTVPQWGDNDDGRILPLDGYASESLHDHRHLLCLGGRLLGRADLEAAGDGRDVEAIWLCGDAMDRRTVDQPSSRRFPSAGYYVLRSENAHVAVSCGPIGTAGLGNHTHNDLLSFVLWVGGREWVTDPGSGTYTRDPALRNRFRSAAAHATLQLGKREPNTILTGLDNLFRMTPAAHAEVIAWSTGAAASLRMRHDGYSGSDGRWLHERSVALDPAEDTLVVQDRLEGPAPAEQVLLRFPLAPRVAARVTERTSGEHDVELSDDRGRTLTMALRLPVGSKVEVQSALYSPRYGVTVPSQTLVATIPPAALIEARTTIYLATRLDAASSKTRTTFGDTTDKA